MPRYKLVKGEKVPFTPEEEAERDYEEANPDVFMPPLTDTQRLDAALPQSDMGRLIFEAFHELNNRVRVLEGLQPITRTQLKTWFKNKLP